VNSRGYEIYARVLARLPATNKAIAQSIGCTEKQAAKYTRDMSAVGLMQRVGQEVVGKAVRPIYGRGGVKVQRAKRPGAMLIVLAGLMRALEAPTSAVDLCDETGICGRQIYHILGALRDHGLARIAQWAKEGNTCTALYALGFGRDAAKPSTKDRREINAAYWRRYSDRLHQRRIEAAVCGASA
jgi:hypothetical protein